jgi:hypothetical protein
VRELRKALKAGETSATWDSEGEAQRFFAEAESAVRWGFWPEAQAAADAALALGKDDVPAKLVRLSAYIGLLKPDQREVIFRTFRPVFGVIASYPPLPPPGSVETAWEAACQIRALLHLQGSVFDDSTLRTLTCNALDTLGELTMMYYLGAELRLGQEERLADMRGVLREVVNLVLDAPEARGSYGDASAPQVIPRGKADLLGALLDYGPLWHETPEEGLKLHARLRALPTLAPAYLRFRHSSKHDSLRWTPPLAGWKWADRRNADKLWREFLDSPQTAPPVSAVVSEDNLPPWARSITERAAGLRRHAFSNRLASPLVRTNPPVLAVAKPVEQPDPRVPVSAKYFAITNWQIVRAFSAENKLWVFHPPHSWNKPGDLPSLTSIALDSGEREVIHLPEKFLSFHQRRESIEMVHFPEKILFFLDSSVVVYDRRAKTFSSVALPVRSPRVLQLGKRIFLYSADAILETTATLEETKVLASPRRNPPQTILDSLPTFQDGALFAVGAERVLLVLPDAAYLLKEGKWRAALVPQPGASFRLSQGGSLAMTVSGGEALIEQVSDMGGHTNAHRAYYFGPASPSGELWFSGLEIPERPPARHPRRFIANPVETAVYPPPPGGLERQGIFGITSTTAFPLRGQLAELSLSRGVISVNGTLVEPELKLWQPGKPRPLQFRLNLQGPDGKPVFKGLKVTVGLEDILFWPSGEIGGVWRVDLKDLFVEEASRASITGPAHAAGRPEPSRFADQNKSSLAPASTSP